ncbi:OmpA family protein [Sorangium sp. So ce131]|uniref:OmpA family protein n=1 Tax=Sorangium sp. So ce131 TaxID=3133282 RepID=UPI003F5E5E11
MHDFCGVRRATARAISKRRPGPSHARARALGGAPSAARALLLGLAVGLVGCGGVTTFEGGRAFTIAGDAPRPPAPPPPEPKKRVVVTEKKIEINEKIQFDHDKATIKQESHSLLNEIVDTIKKHPHIKKIAIEGHASSEGSEAHNLQLSDRRAKAVMQYLVGHGISAGMLTAKGFGASKPIADNGTEDGREKNRRVEFNIVEQDLAKAAN